MLSKILKIKSDYFLYSAWLVSICATLGSLYYSEVLKFTPCVLCWYQRIAMYPLVIILLVGNIRKDKNIYTYVGTLSFIGMSISLFQILLSSGVLPENLNTCLSGVSCTTDLSAYFGFFTIPLQAFIAFMAIFTLSRLHYLSSNK